MPRNRLLLVLMLAAIAAGWGLPFLADAPNRLAAGMPIGLAMAMQRRGWLLLPPACLLLAGPFLPQRRLAHILVAAAAAALLVLLPALAGRVAALLSAGAPPAARISLGGGFWGLFLCSALALSDALRRLRLPVWATPLAGAAIIGAIAGLVLSGRLDALGILREYAAHRTAFADAVLRHLALVGAALLPVIAFGLPLGVLAHRRRKLGRALFAVLNAVQTIPSIALFALLIAPLAALAGALPQLEAIGVGGIGWAPAVIALVLYLLLPLVRSTADGLAGVPVEAVEAARGLGMSPRAILWQVELPLALPLVLAGLRIATLQAIGLAAVAALIGAGGLGAIMFQGLFADALDLVLLGVVPIVGLALLADGMFRLALGYVGRPAR